MVRRLYISDTFGTWENTDFRLIALGCDFYFIPRNFLPLMNL